MCLQVCCDWRLGEFFHEMLLQGGAQLVIHGAITPISKVKNPQLPVFFNAIYRGPHFTLLTVIIMIGFAGPTWQG